jgi:hypothetical protein
MSPLRTIRRSLEVTLAAVLVVSCSSRDNLTEVETEPLLAAGGQDKLTVCHFKQATGEWELRTVAAPALSKHLAHGDGLPGDEVPGMPGYRFDDACVPELIPDYALQFIGTKATQTPDANDLDLGNTFTIELWINPANPSGPRQDLVSKWGAGTEASYDLWTGERGPYLILSTRQEPTNTVAQSTTALVANVWQHVAVVFNYPNVTFYINGAVAGGQGGMFTPQPTVSPLSLGREFSASGFRCCYYQGLMDEVRMWSVARTQAQIQATMNTKLRGIEAGLTAYWPMDEGSGQFAADVSSNGHSMQLGESSSPDVVDPTWVSPGKP